jgi:hypothetical protein
VSKSFSKKSTKKSKTVFFSISFNHVFGRFSVRGVQKHDKKISEKNLTNPGTLLASEEPTNHVGVRHLFFEAPWYLTPPAARPPAPRYTQGALKKKVVESGVYRPDSR